MPTDLLAAKTRSDAAQKREARDTTLVIMAISLGGALFTIGRAFQSDAFQAALIAIAAVE